jgi:PAS domain S-box-containing protein
MREAYASIRVLHVEENGADRELVAAALRAGGLVCDIAVVETGESMRAALAGASFDVILADDRLPALDGRTALELARAHAPTVPFIFVSGTLGEEVAIERMRDGASDYVLKQRLVRLPASVRRALRESQLRAEQERAEARAQRLHDAHGFLEGLIAASPSMIFRIDPADLTVTYASPNVRWLLGYDPAELVGRRDLWRHLLHPDEVETAARRVQDALTSCAVQLEHEYQLRARDGRFRWCFSLMRIDYDDRGQPASILWYCGDISDRRAAERALFESEERIRAILSTANDAFVSADQYGRIAFWNEEAERVFGWTRADAVGRLLVETIVPRRLRASRAERGEWLALGREAVRHRVETWALRSDGTEFPVEITTWPSGTGAHRTVNAFIRDITAAKRAQESVRQAKEEAERANLAKSEFLSRMSHDLRTPLNAILGFAQLLGNDRLSAAQVECVQQILRGGRHLLDLVNEVLDLSRIESGKLSLSPEPVPIHELVAQAVEFVEPLGAQRGITLIVEDDASGRPTVMADRQRLRQVLLNLLANAVKYSRSHSTVCVRLVGVGSRFRINVSDQGPGIPPEKLALLFRPFERLDADSRGIEGTGLGLTLSRGLAEAMGGTIGVVSDIDHGSTFWVELALSAEPAPLPHEAGGTRLPAPAFGTTARVLYIEDNTSNVRLMTRLLGSRPGIQLVHAADGQSGLAAARACHPDVALLDLHLPDMTGEDVLREIVADPELRAIPVIVLSADATAGQMRRLLASGAVAYLTKPLDLPEVMNVLDRTIMQAARPAGDTGRAAS